MIEAALRSVLVTDAGVIASCADRVHPAVRPQDGLLPAIVYSLERDEPFASLTGAGGLHEAEALLVCQAVRRSDAVQLADAARAAIEGSSGTIAGHDVVFMRASHLASDYLEPADGSETGTHVAALTVLIHHRP